MSFHDPIPDLPDHRGSWQWYLSLALLWVGVGLIALDLTVAGWTMLAASVGGAWYFVIRDARRRRRESADFRRRLEEWVQRQPGPTRGGTADG